MDLRAVELRQLRSFLVLAEELHFTRAAAALRVAQPALSQQIRSLEAALGFRLFDRTSRRVELTPAGAAFLDLAGALVGDLERAVQRARHVADGSSGTIAVGYVATAMLTVLPGIIRQLRARRPDVRVLLRELSSGPQIDNLREGKLDVALVTGHHDSAGTSSIELLRDPLVAVLPAGHPSAARRHLSAASLADDAFILFPREQAPVVHDQIVSMCRQSGFEPRIEQEAQSWHTVASLAAAGLGVSIAPSTVRRFRIAGLRFIPIRPAVTMPLVLSYRRADDRALVKSFIMSAEAGSRKS